MRGMNVKCRITLLLGGTMMYICGVCTVYFRCVPYCIGTLGALAGKATHEDNRRAEPWGDPWPHHPCYYQISPSLNLGLRPLTTPASNAGPPSGLRSGHPHSQIPIPRSLTAHILICNYFLTQDAIAGYRADIVQGAQ